uniref:Uncharacterized protein n=1 Tax=Odontella aurita TaxID=265563 RepID=A0A7S4I6K8_9STRA|mmetsp:Transcript_20670/g.60071  ORF Transcript_20670/g.60071 Transcript_20670/m.60071 type:complete len:449 (+) Transcript_20670:377-1723(+)
MCMRGVARVSQSDENDRGNKFINDERTVRSQSHFYLTSAAAAALHKYQYAGADLSLIYKYILSPLALFLVNNATPRTMAPNTITLAGLCLMFAAYCIVWYFCPNLDEYYVTPASIPGWIFAFNCASMVIYQTLDNMDGKQARRTGSSSPLGLMFDHGCDAVNSIFGSANWIAAMGLSTVDDSLTIWALIIGPMAAFYVTTWEEYYTGELILPIINGPSEGLLMGAMLSLVSALMGAEFWHGMDAYDGVIVPYVIPNLPTLAKDLIPENGIRNCDLIAIAAVVALAHEMIFKALYVCRKYGSKAMLNLLPFLILAFGTLWIGTMDPSILVRNPRTCMHLISALFVEMVTQLMLDHMTAQDFKPYRASLAPFCVLAVLVSGGLLSDELVDDYLLTFTVGIWVYLFMKIRVTIHEISCALGIWCFDIITSRPDQANAGQPTNEQVKLLKVT